MQAIFPDSGLPFVAQVNSLLDPREAETLARLLRCAPAPVDYRGFQRFVQGATLSMKAASKYLKQPTQQFIEISQDIFALNQKIEALSISGSLCPAQYGLSRTFAAYPQWRLLFKAGECRSEEILALIGLGLSLSFAQRKALPSAWSKNLQSDKRIWSTGILDLPSVLFSADQSFKAPWLPRAKKAYVSFLNLFESAEFPPLPPRTFSERAQSQWVARAVHATYAVRAGVPDLRSLSSAEFEEFFTRSKDSVELLTAGFIVAFTSFTTDLAADIPFFQGGDPPVCYLDVATGELVRDFTCIAYDSAQPIGIDGIPASYTIRLPLPKNIAIFLQTRAIEVPDASTLGDLVTVLQHVTGDDLLYPSISKVTPSWAKLRYTLGRWLREYGEDSLLAAVLSSDFAHTGKSKLYYSTISPAEWMASIRRTYQLMSLAPPIAEHITGVAFGSRITPAASLIQSADRKLQGEVEQLRPGRNCSEQALTLFHGAYSKVVGFRLMAILVLRETSAIPLINTLSDFAYPPEKSSANRQGQLEAIVPSLLADQMRLFKNHCWSFYERLDSTSRATDFGQWLSLAAHGEAKHLCHCSKTWRAIPVSTKTVLQCTHSVALLAVDFGRKYFENHLRQRGVLTQDVDRCLRHEVKGQEFSSAVAEEIPSAWRRKTQSILNVAATDLFGTAVAGLRRS